MEEVTCTIRRAVPADAEALADLAERTFRDTFATDNRPEDMALHLAQSFGPERQLAEITSAEYVTFLAVREGRPVAFAQLRHGETPPCVTSTRPVELLRFYVDQAWHGRGVAGQLMRVVLEEAATVGAADVWLGVWEHNPRAIAFYRKFGFVDVGAKEFLVGTDLQTDRVMVRSF